MSIISSFNSSIVNNSHLDVLMNNPMIEFFQNEITIKVAKIAGSVLALATLSVGIGRLMQVSGKQLVASYLGENSSLAKVVRMVGIVVGVLGDGLFFVGKYSFLSITVPVYTVGWILPKTLCEEVIKVAQAGYYYTILPLGRLIKDVLIWTWNSVFIPVIDKIVQAVDYVSNAIIKVAQTIYDYALEPIGRGIITSSKWVSNSIVVPLCTGFLKNVIKIATFAYEYILEPLSRAIISVSKWIWNSVVISVCNGIVKAAEYVIDAVAKVAQVIYDYVLNPLGQAIVTASKWIWNSLLMPVINGVVKAAGYVIDAVVKVAQVIYDYALAPIGRVVAEVSNWIWKTIAMPIVNGIVQVSKFVKDAIVKAAQAVYNFAILPTGQFIAKAVSVTFEYTGALCKTVINTGHTVLNSIYETYVWFSGKIS